MHDRYHRTAGEETTMAIRFDLGDLQAFAAVAEMRNFRKAADSVHISQPAFSRRIDKLEAALGVRLLDRDTRKVELTAVGRDFARKTRQLLDDLDSTLLGIQEVAATRMGEVTVACVPSAGFYFLPQVIKRYHAEFPNIRVKIFDASANEVLAAVARGEADFGLNFIGSAEADLEFQIILEEPFVVACRRDHPLATKRSVTWSELRPYDFMTVGKSSGNRLLMDLALAGVPNRPVCIYEAQHVVTLLGLVEAGLGVSAVPRLAMPGSDHPTLVSVPLKDPQVTRRLGLIRRRGRSLSPAAQHLYAMFAELKKKRAASKKKASAS
jgi:DNA-binding transcriptional LysR family regulator